MRTVLKLGLVYIFYSEVMNEEQKSYYQKEWSKLELSDKFGRSGCRTIVPAPDFVQFVDWLKSEAISGRALDIGCGAGRHSILLAQNNYNTYGIDFAKSAIKLAETSAKSANSENSTSFRVGNALALPYDKDYINITNDDGCLHHIEPTDWSLYLNNITRVIKRGGILRIKEFSKNCTYFDQNTSVGSPQWVWLGSSGYTYFFGESDLRRLFQSKFEIITLEESTHSAASDKKFFFLVLRAL